MNFYSRFISHHIAPETNVFYIGPDNLTKQIVAANNCMGYTVGWDRNYIGLLPLGDPVVPVMRVSSDFIFMSVCLICLDSLFDCQKTGLPKGTVSQDLNRLLAVLLRTK